MNFVGTATKLAPGDVAKVATDVLALDEAHLRAVMDVEAAGRGFDAKGRPLMLFEPHIFYAELGDTPLRARAVDAGVAYQKWGARPYPKDSYPHLQEATLLNEEAALRSASWGLGQILGRNFQAAGYASAKDMVLAFAGSEAAQLAGMAKFIKSHGLDRALRLNQWAAFARGYNGSGYAKNHYDTKLASAYTKWVQKLSTKGEPAA